MTQRVRVAIRDACRGLKAGRATTALSFVILSLTLAAGTVAFSVVDAVALRPLPYGEPDRLVGISAPSPTPGAILPSSPQDYFTWLQGARTLASLGAARSSSQAQLRADGASEVVTIERVTANLFAVLGVRPALGRLFAAGDDSPAATAVVVMSNDLWRRSFGGDPGIVGRRLDFADGSRDVIGSYPIRLAAPPDLYVHMSRRPRSERTTAAASMSSAACGMASAPTRRPPI